MASVLVISATAEMCVCFFCRKTLLWWALPAVAAAACAAFFAVSGIDGLEDGQSLAFAMLGLMAFISVLSSGITIGAYALLMRIAKNKT